LDELFPLCYAPHVLCLLDKHNSKLALLLLLKAFFVHALEEIANGSQGWAVFVNTHSHLSLSGFAIFWFE
jgi:hypothetical protein